MAISYPKTHHDWALKTSDCWQGLPGMLATLKHITSLMDGGDTGTGFGTSNGKMENINSLTDWVVSEFLVGPYDEVARVELQCLLFYREFDRQIFCLNPIIQEMFDKTDVGKVGLAEIKKLPYPCFYINLAKSKLRVKNFETGKYHPVSGFYVLRDNTDEDVDKLTFFVHAEGDHNKFGGKYYFSFSLERCFSEFDSVGDYVKFVCRNPERDSSSPGVEHTNKDLREHSKMFMSIYRIFAAFLMYLNMEDPSLRKDVADAKRRKELEDKIDRARSRSKKKKYQTRLQKLKQRANVTYVGEREETRILGQCGGYETERHWRRGHDHRFWTGPKKNKETGEDWSVVPDGILPEVYWEGRRALLSKWVEPTLIHPEKEVAEQELGHNYSLAVPASYLEKRKILEDMYSAMEGALETVTLTRHERSRKNQQNCFKHWGFECRVCGFDPVRDHPLGEMVEDLPSHGLEAHHLTPLGDSDEGRVVSAIDDMRPLCHVCHKVVHARGTKEPPRDVEKMRTVVADELTKRAVILHAANKQTTPPQAS